LIRRYSPFLRALLMTADAVLAALTAWVVYKLRFQLFPGEPDPTVFQPPVAALVLYAAAWVAILYFRGEYRLRAHWTVRSEISGVLHAIAWLAVLTVGVLFFLDLSTASRLFLFLLFPIQGAVTIATRLLLRLMFVVVRSRGYNSRTVLIVGTGREAIDFARLIDTNPNLGLRVIGFIGPPLAAGSAAMPNLGDIADFESTLLDRVVDEVAICLPASQRDSADAISWMSQESGKMVRIPLAVPQLGRGRPLIEELDGTAILSLSSGPDQLASLALKRLIDIVGAVLGLIVLSPVLLVVALYILVKDGRPVLFVQTRVGVHGRTFHMCKFRTMVRDAEERYDEVASLSSTRGPAFKLKDDPRVAPWGRVLRRSSLDELPQLWNVLRGEMSLVGPRPAPPREVRGYDLWHRRRLSMKPGLTGLWQISSRLDDDFDERATLDLDYIDRWSLWLDLRIVIRTLPALLRHPGH